MSSGARHLSRTPLNGRIAIFLLYFADKIGFRLLTKEKLSCVNSTWMKFWRLAVAA